jgi:preprotein translocase subunit SecD
MIKLHWKIWVLIIALICSFLFIAPWTALEKGVVITSVEKNSTEFNAGLRTGQIITSINSQDIKNINDYLRVTSELFQNNGSLKIALNTKDNSFVFITSKELKIIVGAIPGNKLKTGLDLSGGARALITAENKSLNDKEILDLIAITSERFNVYGLKDITLKSVKDLNGNNYMLIEIAGASPSDLENLISNQGKFEAKIGNKSVFIGGKDISHVERSGQQSGIEGCSTYSDGEVCRFSFPISLTEESAKRQADITQNIALSTENPEYLSEKLDLYVDDALIDSLSISKNLKGRVTTQISIQGSGSGTTRQEAITDAQNNMKKLQTILITGSLPYKLQIVKLDTISPNLGREFTKNLIYLALVVFILISIAIFIKYRKIKITSAVILTMFSEAAITLGIAALINWNLDAPSIAGIIAGMGTGVNDQIVLIDESVSNINLSLKERIKRGFFIIMGAFFTIIAAMIPLFWAGAGMLKGFALTTILSVLAGILITRPAFSEILKKIQE